MTYTANWQTKQIAAIYLDDKLFGTIEFEKSNWFAYHSAIITIGSEVFRADVTKGNNAVISKDDVEIFTSVFDKTWGNLELQFAGEDTGYDIRGRWFKPGTRLVDADDNDLIVVKTDAWSGRKMTIEVTDEKVSDILIAATLYHHIRASAAAGLAAVAIM